MKVLIAGCGDLGSRAGLALIERGHEVWGLRRSPERLPDSIRGIAAELGADAPLPELPSVDQVIYALAADGRTDEAYRQAYVDSVRQLLDALRADPPRRWIHVSSTSVYGQTDGTWVDETSATQPSRFTGRRILEGEALLADAGIESTILRLSGIYGPDRTYLLDSVRRGEAVCFDPPVHTNRIHVDDAARALVHLAELAEPASIYLGVDHQPVTDGRVKRWLAKRLGVAEPPSGPRPAGGRASSDKRCSNRRLVASGFTFEYPDFRSGYGAIVDASGGSNDAAESTSGR